MIYDGHLSHINYVTICYTHEKNVTILKLPPHSINVFQSLGVAVFKSFKEKWGNALYKGLIKTRTLSKSGFSTVLSSDEVWRSSFIIKRIQNGFQRQNNVLTKFILNYTVTNDVVFCKIGALPKNSSAM